MATSLTARARPTHGHHRNVDRSAPLSRSWVHFALVAYCLARNTIDASPEGEAGPIPALTRNRRRNRSSVP